MAEKNVGGGVHPNKGDRDVPALFAAYLAGDSLAEIGKREGVSGERIRQLFREAGFTQLQEGRRELPRR